MHGPEPIASPSSDTRVIAFAARLPASSFWCSLAVAFIGLIALLGWATHIEILKSVVPGLVTMKVNTAFSLILLAGALAAANRPGIMGSGIVLLCLILSSTSAIVTACEYLFHADLHIDNLVFQDSDQIAFPGRMAPTTIICFLLYAAAILMLQSRRGVFLAQVIMGMVIAISLATLGGYLYGAPQMRAHATYPVVALHTATGMVLLCIGGLFKRPTQGPMRVMMAQTTGGWLARRLIPTAMVVPLAVGLCVVTGQRAGIYSAAFAVALTVSADIAVMTAVVWSVAALLSRTDALRQLTEQTAEKHSQLKDNFLATLSHELRTPLMAILGWAVLLAKRDDLDADTRLGVEIIERNTRAQAKIIEDLLDMSRIISGKMHLEVQRLDLCEAVADAIQTVRPSAGAKGVELRVKIGTDTPAVMGDRNRIQQIAWNLLSNAVKFTPRGGWVRVSLERYEKQVQLVVSDSGLGLKEEFLPHVFERFRQADAGTTRVQGGLGLGLSIVRQLVELHGGTASAQSPGEWQGSTFTVSFPIAAIAQESTSDGANVPSTLWVPGEFANANPGSKEVMGLRVLVVDDEPDARSLIRRILEDCNAIVVTADSANAAIAQLDVGHFDVLICDIGMPHQDGYDLIRTIRQRDANAGRDLPAAALTAFARSEDRTRALSSGFQLHATKPVEPSELIATVASLARRAKFN